MSGLSSCPSAKRIEYYGNRYRSPNSPSLDLARSVLAVQSDFISRRQQDCGRSFFARVLLPRDKFRAIGLSKSKVGPAFRKAAEMFGSFSGLYPTSLELASNLMAHGGGGIFEAFVERTSAGSFISLFSMDTGRGIKDFLQELAFSWSTHEEKDEDEDAMSASDSPGRGRRFDLGFGTANIVRYPDEAIIESHGRTWIKDPARAVSSIYIEGNPWQERFRELQRLSPGKFDFNSRGAHGILSINGTMTDPEKTALMECFPTHGSEINHLRRRAAFGMVLQDTASSVTTGTCIKLRWMIGL